MYYQWRQALLKEFFSAETWFRITLLLYPAAAVVAVLFGRRQEAGSLMSHLVCMTAAAAGAASALMALLSGSPDIRLGGFESTVPFLSMELRMDSLSAFFLLSLSILVFCVSLYSIGYLDHYFGKRNVGYFNFIYSLFILAMILVFTSGNMVVFYLSWEAMSVLSYLLVVFESDQEENRKAGILYIVMTHVGAAFLLAGFLIIYGYTGSFSLFEGTDAMPAWSKNAAFLLFLLGFGVKAGAIPIHIWLPRAHPAAPSNISALMSGIMIKTAVFGLLRFIAGLLGVQETWWGVTILVVGMASAVIGVSYAFVENNIKRMLAYSSIENIGIILIGLGTSFIATSQGHGTIGALALTAALVHTLNHTLFKGSLFLGAGSIHYATHTKNLEEMGGLIKRMPVTAFLFLGGALSVSALVPFNGFIGEWLTYQSLFASLTSGDAVTGILSILAVAALAMAGALAAAGFVKLYGIAFLGLPRSTGAGQAQEVPRPMSAGTGILAVLCLAIGLFPAPVLRMIGGVVTDLTGVSLAGDFSGGMLALFRPLEVSGNRISPLAMAVVAAGILLLTLPIIRLVGGKYMERRYGTWDCGFGPPNSRMQYSATGFSKPIRIVFRILFRPSRQTRVSGDRIYHPESIEYTTSTENVFEKYLYHPFYKKLRAFSRRTKFRVQTGRIHSYLFYILAAVVVLMIYNLVA